MMPCICDCYAYVLFNTRALRVTTVKCSCALDDIPSDAEAEGRSQHVEDPELLPVDPEEPEILEQVSRIGMLWCKLGTVCYLI